MTKLCGEWIFLPSSALCYGVKECTTGCGSFVSHELLREPSVTVFIQRASAPLQHNSALAIIGLSSYTEPPHWALQWLHRDVWVTSWRLHPPSLLIQCVRRTKRKKPLITTAAKDVWTQQEPSSLVGAPFSFGSTTLGMIWLGLHIVQHCIINH